ncbi:MULTISPECIES: hypothetical protein [Ferroplasma]|jgi:hypothetical protein|uniref:Multipass membrane protein n=2 Tax=Ferroplasma TaxID=74968 RepID=S0AM19_FERAC|nr:MULTISPECIES: hypothetical protein [Ferroplasma]MCL4349032.1 hypothetical protein [Candidatus Thermoplasmatota archaeon]AGO60328.1 hypothetical protein FACI_IFERC00001G0348 [Ferroplasma acidarmanus Fer1]ARD85135.1 multipass membrane protein [Ferroplasma acidiphilum]NOL59840.1 hypothetical protein [Ferroplasma acidiphilum]WMT54078.1 MAG: hypothetical protein RE473_04310 [Ferroplasma acidiphilum]
MLIDYAIASINAMMGRIDDIVISVSAVLITLLWIPIALNFFSTDENKKIMARERLKNAAIGTVIFIMAISGILFTVFNYVVTGKV